MTDTTPLPSVDQKTLFFELNFKVRPVQNTFQGGRKSNIILAKMVTGAPYILAFLLQQNEIASTL